MSNRPGKFSLTGPQYRAFSQKTPTYWDLAAAQISADPCIFIRYLLFSAKDPRICPTHFKQMFTKPLKARTLDDSVLEFWNFVGGGGVRRFFLNISRTKQDIKNPISKISRMNSKDYGIWMASKAFDHDLHRLVSFRIFLKFNKIYLNLYNSPISKHI